MPQIYLHWQGRSGIKRGSLKGAPFAAGKRAEFFVLLVSATLGIYQKYQEF